MNILVCIKQVPETQDVKINKKTGTLIREGIPTIINPDDKAGIEFALRIKDEKDEVNVTAITMGPAQGEMALREALAMGVDRAVLLTDMAFSGADTFATAATLAGVIKKLEYDLVIAGRHAIDGETAQVGPELAEHLGIPQITHCEEISMENGKVIAKRQFEDRYHIIEADTPCLVTVIGEKIKPRYMTVQGVFNAFKPTSGKDYTGDRIEKFTLEDLKDFLNYNSVGVKGSPTTVEKIFEGNLKGDGEKLTDLSPEDAAEAILQKLISKSFI